MRTFGTRGPVNPEKNYVVERTDRRKEKDLIYGNLTQNQLR